MTFEDAGNLCDVFVTADGGCGNCIAGMCEYANLMFPEFVWYPIKTKEGERVKVVYAAASRGKSLTGRTYYEMMRLKDPDEIDEET